MSLKDAIIRRQIIEDNLNLLKEWALRPGSSVQNSTVVISRKLDKGSTHPGHVSSVRITGAVSLSTGRYWEYHILLTLGCPLVPQEIAGGGLPLCLQRAALKGHLNKAAAPGAGDYLEVRQKTLAPSEAIEALHWAAWRFKDVTALDIESKDPPPPAPPAPKPAKPKAPPPPAPVPRLKRGLPKGKRRPPRVLE